MTNRPVYHCRFCGCRKFKIVQDEINCGTTYVTIWICKQCGREVWREYE